LFNQSEFFESHPFRQNGRAARKLFTTQTERDTTISNYDSAPPPTPPHLVHRDDANGISLYHGNCLDLLDSIATKNPDGVFDMVFADPPYFLSNGGSTCQNGERVSVDKGRWDTSRGLRQDFKFTLAWLRGCRRVLKPNGTLWVTGTPHSIHLVGYALQKLRFRILNDIAWEKPNPPPNLSCRCFTHSTETLIWAARSVDSDYVFNYDVMRGVNGGRQMQTVWTLGAPEAEEKAFGDHPTQKPLALVTRCLLAATNENGLVFDPFLGSGTTAIACQRTWRRCVGIESRACYAALAGSRAKAEAEQGSDLFAPMRAW
jgi:site-specific DNA-methyltransferase (adenine-specific)